MRYLLAFLFAATSFGSTVNCVNNSATDKPALQASLNAGGTTTMNGPCTVNGTLTITVANTHFIAGSNGNITQQTNGQVLLDYASVTGLVTNGLIIHGGAINANGILTSWTFTNNQILDVTGGAPNGGAIVTNGLVNSTITGNTIDNAFDGGYVAYGNPPYPGPVQPACWQDYAGMSGTVMSHNRFTKCANDGFHINPSGGRLTSTAPNEFGYNYCANTHRACYELQAFMGTNVPFVIKANVAKDFNGPFFDSFAYSIASVGNGLSFYNNLGTLNSDRCEYGVATFFEIFPTPTLVQGNVAQSMPINTNQSVCFIDPSGGGSGARSWNFSADNFGQFFPGSVDHYNNNIMCGNAVQVIYDHENNPTGNHTVVETGDYKNATSCPNAGGGLGTSNVGAPAFVGPPTSFPSGGNGTWNVTEISAVPISNMSFYIDGSSTPVVFQEIQDVSSTFGSNVANGVGDLKWLYHATFNTSTLSGGSHTIKAVATDVLGSSNNTTVSFSTGSGPGASFSPATLAFGTITLGNTSPPQTTTLTNTGTTSLSISSGPSLTGANAGDFAITGTTCTSTLSASASCTVTATFHPTVLGSRIAQISITDNASGSPHQVQLTGGASLCIAGNLVSQCDFANGPNSLASNGGPWGFNGGSFGSVQVDNTGPNGTFAAHITAIASVPPGNNIELFQDSLTFPANGTMMQLTFSCQSTPSQQVNILGILSVSPFTSYGLAWMPTFPSSYGTYPNCKSPFFKVQGSPTSGSGRLTFQADGVGPGSQVYIDNVNLLNAGSVPSSQPSVSSVAFTSQTVGTTQNGSPITITNGGIANLVISNISYSTGNTGDFGLTSNGCVTTLTPGSSCSFTPTFTPSAVGSRISSIVITSNDTSVSPQSIPVSGIGVGGATEVTSIFPILVSHGSVYFGFTTQTASNAVRVRYNVSGCASGTGGLVQTNFLNNIPATFAALPVGGLLYDTQYSICAEVSKDGGATWSSGGPELVATTLNLPSPHPALPIAPLTFNTAYPVTTGYTSQSANSISTFSTAYATGCTNWTAGTGQIINMAAGTVMTTTSSSPFSFSCLPPDVHTVAVSDVTLPSTITWTAHGFSENDLVEFGRSYGLSVNYPVGGGCDTGKGSTATVGIQSGQRYPVHVVDANHIQPRCLPTSFIADTAATVPTPPIMVWTGAPTATGGQHMVAVAYKSTGNDANGNPIWQRRMPTSPYAVTPQFIIQTAGAIPPEHTALTPAWSSGLFTFHADSSFISSTFPQHPFIVFGDPDPNVEIPTGPYRFVGAEVTTDNYNPISSDPYFWSALIYTHPWDDQIVWDRSYYHIPDNNREFRGMQWDGSNQGWVDSYFDNLVYMRPSNIGLNLASTGSKTFTIASGTSTIPNGSSFTLGATDTVTLTGSTSGRVRAYWNLANSGALTVAVPTGITASCSPTACATPSSSGSTDGSCPATLMVNNPNPSLNSASYVDFPHYGSGESSAALIGCADLTSGNITTAGPANIVVSQWNGEGDSHMIGGFGPGPYVFNDNYSDGCGITWHFDDSGGFGFRGNYTWNRNYIKQDRKFMFGSSTTQNLFCDNRQPLEWKGGQYIQAKGNIFDGVWREIIPDSGFFAIQPLNGGQVTDVDFTSNTLEHGSAILQGPTNTCGGTASSCGLSMRIHLNNNLTFDIDGYKYQAHNPDGSDGPGLGWGNQFSAVEDPFIEHQTDGTPNKGVTSWLLSNTSVAIEGYNDINGIHWFSGVPEQVTSMYGDGTGNILGVPPGCSGLSNFALMQCQFTPFFSFQNLLLGGYMDNSVPSGQSTVSTMTTAFGALPNSYLANGTVTGTSTSVQWRSPTTNSANDYCLSVNSPYNAGNNSISHDFDLGIDCDKLAVDQGKLNMIGVPASALTSTGFTVAYRAPDAGACFVGTSTTNNVTTATWVSDGGGDRTRNFAKTGLTTQTEYFGWVYCSGNAIMSQSNFKVKTR